MTMSFHSISLEPIYTPQGDGNTPFMYLSKYVTETLHTPQGDGNLAIAVYSALPD